MREWLRHRFRSEAGMTLVEVLITVAIVAVVLTVFMNVMVSVQRSYTRESDRTITNDQARLAIEELDREIRSGNVLYDPTLESDPAHDIAPGMSLRIYTQSNANSRPGFRCVQWRITSDGQLQHRNWWTNWHDDPDTLVSGWRVIAENLVNRTQTPAVSAFSLDTSDPAYGNRIVKIVLLVNRNAASAAQPLRIQSSIEGRDTTFGYPTSACAEIPPY